MATLPPDFETLVIQRLYICNQEILAGAGRAYQLPPANPPGIGEFPIMYAEVGPMLQAVPRADSSAGKFMVERNYTIKTAVASLENTEDIGNLGVDALNNALDMIAKQSAAEDETSPLLKN
jgi:hypothetical protein